MKTSYLPISEIREIGFNTEFGKTLTDEQILLIRKYNDSNEYPAALYDALNVLLDWDLELICREKIQ